MAGLFSKCKGYFNQISLGILQTEGTLHSFRAPINEKYFILELLKCMLLKYMLS